jgi:hypothetical protein
MKNTDLFTQNQHYKAMSIALLDWMEDRNIDIVELAEKSGVELWRIDRSIAGELDLQFSEVLRICLAFGTTPDGLIGASTLIQYGGSQAIAHLRADKDFILADPNVPSDREVELLQHIVHSIRSSICSLLHFCWGIDLGSLPPIQVQN